MTAPAGPKPWPRGGVDRARPGTWYVASDSQIGVFWRVEWLHTPDDGHYWTCGCPAGRKRRMMGHGNPNPALSPPCRHVRRVAVAEDDDGYPPRPTGTPNISGLVD